MPGAVGSSSVATLRPPRSTRRSSVVGSSDRATDESAKLFGHRSNGTSDPVVTGFEKLHDVMDRPAAQAGALVVGDVRGEPVLDVESAQVFAGLVRPHEIFRRMAGAAMAGALDKKRAAIPFSRFLRIGFEPFVLEKKE